MFPPQRDSPRLPRTIEFVLNGIRRPESEGAGWILERPGNISAHSHGNENHWYSTVRKLSAWSSKISNYYGNKLIMQSVQLETRRSGADPEPEPKPEVALHPEPPLFSTRNESLSGWLCILKQGAEHHLCLQTSRPSTHRIEMLRATASPRW